MKPNGYYFMANGKESFHFFAMFMVGKLKIHPFLKESFHFFAMFMVGKLKIHLANRVTSAAAKSL